MALTSSRPSLVDDLVTGDVLNCCDPRGPTPPPCGHRIRGAMCLTGTNLDSREPAAGVPPARKRFLNHRATRASTSGAPATSTDLPEPMPARTTSDSRRPGLSVEPISLVSQRFRTLARPVPPQPLDRCRGPIESVDLQLTASTDAPGHRPEKPPGQRGWAGSSVSPRPRRTSRGLLDRESRLTPRLADQIGPLGHVRQKANWRKNP